MSIFVGIIYIAIASFSAISCQRTDSRLANLPSICLGGADRGICSANVPRFYFNNRTLTCQEFSYSGCGGNDNNFWFKESCERRCVKKPKKALKDHPELKRCFLKRDEGPGRAMFKKFYYDKSDRRCKQFSYGGMYGNDNRFDSKEECLEKCARRISPYLQLLGPNKNKQRK